LRRLLAEGEPDADDLAELTPREREILRCMVDGLNRPEIADRLGLSANTYGPTPRTFCQARRALGARGDSGGDARRNRPSNPGDDPPM